MVNNKLVIGISGEIGTGKDTSADILVAKHGFHKVTIGKHVRREFINAGWLIKSGKILPKSARALLTQCGAEGRTKKVYAKPTSPEVRESLQWFGELMVSATPLHWISQVLCEIRDNPSDRIVWCDIRRTTEVEALRELQGKLWLIQRRLTSRSIHAIRASQHITETEMQSFEPDLIIKNSGTLLDLDTKVQSALRSVIIT